MMICDVFLRGHFVVDLGYEGGFGWVVGRDGVARVLRGLIDCSFGSGVDGCFSYLGD